MSPPPQWHRAHPTFWLCITLALVVSFGSSQGQRSWPEVRPELVASTQKISKIEGDLFAAAKSSTDETLQDVVISAASNVDVGRVIDLCHMGDLWEMVDSTNARKASSLVVGAIHYATVKTQGNIDALNNTLSLIDSSKVFVPRATLRDVEDLVAELQQLLKLYSKMRAVVSSGAASVPS